MLRYLYNKTNVVFLLSLDAQAYRPRKEHRQVLNAWNRFILGEEYRFKIARLCPRTRE